MKKCFYDKNGGCFKRKVPEKSTPSLKGGLWGYVNIL